MITDILMDGLSGVELAERLSFKRPEMRVLFATGYPAGLTEGAKLGGEANLLKKPFSGRELATKHPRDPRRGATEDAAISTIPRFRAWPAARFCYKRAGLRRPEPSPRGNFFTGQAHDDGISSQDSCR